MKTFTAVIQWALAAVLVAALAACSSPEIPTEPNWDKQKSDSRSAADKAFKDLDRSVQ